MQPIAPSTAPLFPAVLYSSCEAYQAQVPIGLTAAAPGQRPAVDVALVAVDPKEARAWQVTLGPIFGPGYTVPHGFGVTGVQALVTWGIGRGAQLTTQVDWRVGCSFVVHGAMVNVQALVPESTVTTPLVGDLTFSAQIVPSVDGNNNGLPPTYTVDTGDIANAASAIFLLERAQQFGTTPLKGPGFARLLRWYPYKPAGFVAPLAMQIELADDGGFTVLRYDSGTIFTSSVLTWPAPRGLPLPASTYVRVTNRGGVGTTLALMLELELDI